MEKNNLFWLLLCILGIVKLRKKGIDQIGSYPIFTPTPPMVIYDHSAISGKKIKVIKNPAQYFGRQINVTITEDKLDFPIIKNSKDSYDILRYIYKGKIEVQEYFICLFLNKRFKVIGYYIHTIGTNESTIIDIKLLVATALKALTRGVILSHNHPSGTLAPSEQDVLVTKNIKNAFEPFNINVLDHLILTKNDYYSFQDHQIL
jgi:DNA repair protein RadC